MIRILLILATLISAPAFADLKIQSAYLDFGFVEARSYHSRYLTVTNHGRETARLRIIGASGFEFRAYTDCPQFLPPGGRCSIDVTFNPPWPNRYYSDYLTVGDDFSSEDVYLRGWTR